MKTIKELFETFILFPLSIIFLLFLFSVIDVLGLFHKQKQKF